MDQGEEEGEKANAYVLVDEAGLVVVETLFAGESVIMRGTVGRSCLLDSQDNTGWGPYLVFGQIVRVSVREDLAK